MQMIAFAVLGCSIVLDVAGQLFFKLGLNGDSGNDQQRPAVLKALTSPMVWAGIAAYTVELCAWLFVLSRLPLSVAFPIAGLSYCGIAIGSRFILNERVSRQRWIGTIFIAVGVAIVSMTT